MKIFVMRRMEVDVDSVRMVLPVRYDEEDIPNDFPHRMGDTWDITVDIETGQIFSWPVGVSHEVDIKVVDMGSYYLMNGSEVVGSREEDYVPDCIPGRYGDYVEFNIDAAGFITNWDKTANFSELLRSED